MCGVGPDVRLGEQEGRHRPRRTPRQVGVLLRGRSGQLERFWNADGLMGRQQHRERGMHRPDEHQRPVVRELAETETSVPLRDLDSEAAEFGQALHVGVRYAALTFDHRGIERRAVLPQPRQERLATCLLQRARGRFGVDEIEAEMSEVQLLRERRLLPALPRLLGESPGLLLRHRLPLWRGNHEGSSGPWVRSRAGTPSTSLRTREGAIPGRGAKKDWATKAA
ncbi:hypothetical protein SAXI111661_06565 [Saccharomonospora xinjiangensis]